MANDNMKHRRLQELDRSDFEIVEGQPDIRDWDVKVSSGEKVGEVEELILDAQERRVRYLVLDLEDNEFDLDERKVLIPIGLAQLQKDDEDVLLPGVQVDQLRDLPTYREDHLDAEVERRVCRVLGRSDMKESTGTTELEPEFYQHSYFSDDIMFRDRLSDNNGSRSGSGIDQQRYNYLNERSNRTGDYDNRRNVGYDRSGDPYQNEKISDGSAMHIDRNLEEPDDMRRDQDLRNDVNDTTRDDYRRNERTRRDDRNRRDDVL